MLPGGAKRALEFHFQGMSTRETIIISEQGRGCTEPFPRDRTGCKKTQGRGRKVKGRDASGMMMDAAGDEEDSMGGSLGVMWCGFGWQA